MRDSSARAAAMPVGHGGIAEDPAISVAREEALVAAAAQVLDGIHEPCALARGQRLGLVSAGMIEAIAVRQSRPLAWEVQIRGLTTSPSCLMYLYFEREARRRLECSSSIAELSFDWRFGAAVLQTGGPREPEWIRAQTDDGWSLWRPVFPASGAATQAPSRA